MAQKTTQAARKRAEARQAERNMKNRLIGAGVCLFLGICSVFGYFSSDAWFIKFFRQMGTSLFGWGFIILPLALFGCAYILAFKRERPAALRVTCTLLLVPMLGILLHIALCKIDYEFSWILVRQLFNDGMALLSGGLISGFLGVLFIKLLGLVCSIIIVSVLLVVLAMISLRITPAGIVESRRKRLESREAEEEERAKRASTQKAEYTEAKAYGSSKKVIDIPVDDPPLVKEQKKKTSLFNRTPGATPPDRAFGAPSEAKAEPAAAVSPTPSPVVPATPVAVPQTPSPAPEPAAAFEPPVPEVREMPKPKKDEPIEKVEVARAIEQGLTTSEVDYVFPPVSLLTLSVKRAPSGAGDNEMQVNAQRLEATMHNFGINARIANITRGPTVTRYEVELEQGVRLNKLTNLADDIALSLGASGVRIAPIPDKISIVGIEVPNKLVSTVYIRELVESSEFRNSASKVTFALGKDIGGKCIVGNIEKLPHMLIAGTTGSGKSVCMNSLIISLLYKAKPEEVRFIMIDPKMIELGVYNGIPHLLIPVVTDPKKASGALQWAVAEMMKRYRLFSEVGVKNITTYNAACEKDPERQKLPQIVILIDELADLMIAAAKEVEESICRIAQMARAAGMHLIIATQRPSADVITGLMKANIPSRIAFAVASQLESRIIMDTPGAEKLIGRGDMLYFPLGAGKPLRIQGTLIGEEEVEAVVEFVKKSSGAAQYSEEIIRHIEKAAEDKKSPSSDADSDISADDGDELLPAAIEVVLESGQASVSMLQRRLKLGYSRAARLVDQMEDRGIVGPFEGSKPRQLLITKAQWKEMQLINGTAPTDDFFPDDDEEDSFSPDYNE